MECYSRPRDALHVRHRGKTIDVRFVPYFLLDDAKDSCWCRVVAGAGRYFGVRQGKTVSIEGDALVANRNDDVQRPARHIQGLLSCRLPALLPGIMSAPGVGPRGLPRCRQGLRSLRRQTAIGHPRRHHRRDVTREDVRIWVMTPARASSRLAARFDTPSP